MRIVQTMQRNSFKSFTFCLAATSQLFCLGSAAPLPATKSALLKGLDAPDWGGGTIDVPFQVSSDYGGQYTITFSVGTPPQQNTIAINTGIGDIIISNSTLDRWVDGGYQQQTYYDTQNSATYKAAVRSVDFNNATYTLQDPKGITDMTIIYSQDSLNIAGSTFEDIRFISGLAYTKNAHRFDGHFVSYYLGLGSSDNSASWGSPGGGSSSPYNTFLQSLVNQNFIQSQAYSIWLDVENSLGSPGGHLLLGGINAGRYQWPLVELNTSVFASDTVSQVLAQNQLTLTITNIAWTIFESDGSKLETQDIVADAPLTGFASGFLMEDFYSYFPPAYTYKIWDTVNATYDASDPNTIPLVSCELLQNRNTLDLTFAGASELTVSILISDMIYENGTGPDLSYGNSNSTCQIAIKPTPANFPNYLSKSLLKSLYLLYDLENNIISGALVNQSANATDHIISVPPKGIAAIPASAFDTVGSNSNSSPVATSAATAETSSTSKADAKRTVLIPILASIFPAMVVFICIAIYLFYRQREKRRLIEEREKAATKQTSKNVEGTNAAQGTMELDASNGPIELPTQKDSVAELRGSSGLPTYNQEMSSRERALQERTHAGEIFEIDGLAMEN